MAIVDKTHTQTIEEAFSSVAEGGTSATIIPFHYNEVLGSGGFVKKQEGPFFEYYTFAEIKALYEESNGMLLAYRDNKTAGASPAFITVGNNHAEWQLCVFYAPSEAVEENLYFTTFDVFLTADGYLVHEHVWYTAITNDD